MKLWLPILAFVTLMAASAAYFFFGTGVLPDRIAVHFAADGSPNGFSTREEYRHFLLVFGLGVPLAAALCVAVLPNLLPAALINLPNKDYWLAPERRAQSMLYLGAHGFWLGCLLLLLMCGVHALVASANAAAAAGQHLAGSTFLWVLGGFFAGMAAWAVTLMLRFRRPPAI
ncbi:MAG TPA: hypothetical protein VGN52_02010 [Burkholderiales bacterium]|jgi:hypothetical protein